jgi:hypothetical protein
VIGATKDVAHGVYAYVGEVHNHADPIHLLDQFSSGRRDAAPVRWRFDRFIRFGAGFFDHGGVGVDVVAVVGEGCVAHAEGVVGAEVGEGVADLVETFDADGGDVEAGFEIWQSCARIARGRELSWVGGLKAVEEVYLVVGEGNGLCVLDGVQGLYSKIAA